MDRTIHFGDSEADARYRTQDSDPTGGDFVVVEDLSGGGQLLLWDYAAGEFVYGGPVNLGSNGLTTTGTVTAGTLEAEKADTRGGYEDVSSSRAFDTVETNTTGSDLDVKVVIESSADGVEIDLFLRTERPDGTVRTIDEHNQTLDSGQKTTVGITVPAGADYELLSFGPNYTIKKWSEQS